MFGKLIKYEIKAAGKWYILTYLSTLGLSLMFGLLMKIWLGNDYSIYWLMNDSDTLRTNLQVVSLIILVVLSASLTLATFFLIINRFYTNVYGREGYLTLTLPVTSHQIILSKLAAASFWMFLSSFTVVISFFLYFLPGMNLSEILVYLPEIVANINAYVPLPLVVVASFAAHLSSVLLIYLAISIGQLFQNRRGLMSFVAYFGLYIALTFISAFIIPSDLYNDVFGTRYFMFILISSVIQALISYVAINYLMKHHLNIQ